MAQDPRTVEQRPAATVAEILARMSEMDTSSEPSTSVWLSRFLAQVNEEMQLGGCAVLVSEDKDLRVLAKHNLTPTDLECITARLRTEAYAEDKGELASGRERRLTFESDAGILTAFWTPLRDAGVVWLVFATPAEPSQVLVDVLDIVTLHVARFISGAALQKQLALSVDNAEKLTKELKEMQVCSLNMMEDLQKKNRDLATLNRISREMTSRTSLSELARTAVGAMSNTFDGACVSLYILDTKASSFGPYHSSRDLPGDPDQYRVPASSDLAAKIADGQEITFDTTGGSPELALATAVEAKSGIILPLHSKSSLLGFLVVCETRWHRIFTQDEKENLRLLASTLAIAIENATLLTRTANQVEQMNLLTEYIETVVDSVDLSVLVIDAGLKVGMINKGFERMYGQGREQYIGKHLFEAFPHLMEQGFKEIAKEVLSGTPFARLGWRRKVMGGREFVQNMHIFPHRKASGKIIGAIVIIEDVTEKTDLEIQLAKSEAKFQSLVEDLGDGYLILTQGRVVYANKAASHLTGIAGPELLGTEIAHLLSDGQLVAECTSGGGKKIRRESRLIHSTGTWIPIELSLNPCEYGGNQSVSVVIRDATERKKFEKQLELKNREMSIRTEQITSLNSELEGTVNKLKESQENLIKSERLAAITETSVAANHEINNPLFSILGQAQLLLRKYAKQDEDTVHRLRMIEESALRIACVTKKLANLVEPVVKEYEGLATPMIDVDRSTTR